MFPIHFQVFFFGFIYLLTGVQSVNLGDGCDSHVSCNYGSVGPIANSKCESGSCVCANRYYGETGDAQCLKGRLGDICNTQANGTEFCLSGDEHSLCDDSTNTCACQVGYEHEGSYQPQICRPVVPGTTCTLGATGDALCQTNIANGYCAQTNECSCPAGDVRQVHIPSLKTCHMELFTESCRVCRVTGGRCYDVDSDGQPDGCECPDYKLSSSDDRLAVGCDVGLAEIGELCGVSDSVNCRPDNSKCNRANDLSGRAECTCLPGYIKYLTPGYDVRRKSECYNHLSHFTDPNCATCEQNNGKCYDIDGDRLRDGCDCPDSRSTTDPDDPNTDCDIVHLNIDCMKEEMRVCYTPHNNSYHYNIGDRLASGNSYIYIRNHHGVDPCIFKRDGDDWCLTLSLSTDKYEACGTKVNVPTKSIVSYQNFIVVQMEDIGRSQTDLNYHVYCQYDTKVHTVASGAEIDEYAFISSEGEKIHPEMNLNIYDKFGRDATQVSVGLGHPVFLRVEMTNNKAVYNSIRVELCVASNQPELSTPESSTVLLLYDGCPTDNNAITQSNTFAWEPNNPEAASTGLFPIFTFQEPNNVFFHCAVSVCRRKDDCTPKVCSSRKRRSDDSEGLMRSKRASLVDQSGKLNQNLLKSLRTGSVTVSSNGGSSINSGQGADQYWGENEPGFFDSDENIMIIGVVVGVVILIIIIVVILLCCCGGGRKTRRTVRYANPRPTYPQWGQNPYMHMPMPNPYYPMVPPPYMSNQNQQGGGQAPKKDKSSSNKENPSIPGADKIPTENNIQQTSPQQLQLQMMMQQWQAQNMLLQMQPTSPLQQLLASMLPPSSAEKQTSPPSATATVPCTSPMRSVSPSTTWFSRNLQTKGRHSLSPSAKSTAVDMRSSLWSLSSIPHASHATQTTWLTGRDISKGHLIIPRPQIVLPRLYPREDYWYY